MKLAEPKKGKDVCAKDVCSVKDIVCASTFFQNVKSNGLKINKITQC